MKYFISLLFLSLLGLECYSQTKFIHVFVCLCDNENQGIVPVPKKIGNGNDADNNLYWGCAFGMRTYFKNSAEWELVSSEKIISKIIMERCVFRHATSDVVLVADAYRGKNMRECLFDYFQCLSGNDSDTIKAYGKIFLPGSANLATFIGHDGLMDTQFDSYPKQKGIQKTDAMIFCCYSKEYFSDAVKSAGANPLLWTTGLMSPEAYSLKAALDGWLLKETPQQIRERAAQAYHKYQQCGIKGARGLFTTGF